METKVELLLPAGNFEKMKTAFLYGADAVYVGGPALGLRAKAGNFDLEGLDKAIRYAHDRGKKIYVTTNIYANNRDIDLARTYLRELASLSPDALIVSDLGLFRMIKNLAPNLGVHISTQANTTNLETCRFYQDLGVDRVVLAREMTLEEIRETSEKTDMSLEVFVHGAMCMSYSGRCLLSMFMTNKSANRGACTHPCRWKYQLVEEQRPGHYLPIEEDERGSYIFNSKDLCTIHELDQIIGAGVDSLKIEGRMKSVHYVATVAKAYRQAIDRYYADPKGYQPKRQWLEELALISDRDYCTGFYFSDPSGQDHNYADYDLNRAARFCGVVKSYDEKEKRLYLEQRNRFFTGDLLEALTQEGDNISFRAQAMQDEAGQPISVCPHPKESLSIFCPTRLRPGTLIRLRKEASRA